MLVTVGAVQREQIWHWLDGTYVVSQILLSQGKLLLLGKAQQMKYKSNDVLMRFHRQRHWLSFLLQL